MLEIGGFVECSAIWFASTGASTALGDNRKTALMLSYLKVVYAVLTDDRQLHSTLCIHAAGSVYRRGRASSEG